MSKEAGLIEALLVKVVALLPIDWRSRAGAVFRDTTERLSEVSDHYQIKEKVEELPELGFLKLEGLASKEHAAAVNDYAQAEAQRIKSALDRRTLESKVRQDVAAAELAESNVRLSRLKETEAKLDLLKKFRELGVTLTEREDGDLVLVKAPVTFDWERATQRLLTGSRSPSNPPRPIPQLWLEPTLHTQESSPDGQTDPRIVQYSVGGLPPRITILIQDMATTEAPRWSISRDDAKTWAGDFESAEVALEALQSEFVD